ncbi:MAG: phosphate ABC transporter permease [Cyanobacteria bacterium SW_5_48_44]|jgi:hypothetical protein|nr:MAG: phosphate ABC transporter permease [Cyanobacteria bacterium QS_5_48_63]PSO98937.1 MAG: phosphate ABC transporter permease [Cyanobacteria bacterium QS_9_48_30]PSP15854.1 MAG: phosphate ABC transporter permease [Cyanobacteria bacterium SW_5_48_44]
MLVSLTRKKFEQIVPLIATGVQYRYYWGKLSDLLRRLLISFIAVLSVLLIGALFGRAGESVTFIFAAIVGLYWLWAPIYWASLRNAACRRFQYSGFFRGRVLDVFVTEELIGEQQTVNNRGELMVVENRERRLNLEVGDETGFQTQLQAPLRRIHQVIAPGQIVELLVLSHQSDLSRIAKITDAYLPTHQLWVGEYPYLRRDMFAQVSRQLREAEEQRREKVRG